MPSKVVMITGASAGIGEALARCYAGRGARVALLARSEGKLEGLARELDSSSEGRVLAIGADVCRDGDLERAAETVRERWGRLDVAIANAGFSVSGSLERLTLDDYRRQMETNVFGVLRTIYATLPMLKESHGSLGLVGSVSGYVALPGMSPYCMSKYAVRALAESLCNEVAKDGVSVTHIAPGFVESDIRQRDNSGVVKEGAKDPVPEWLVMDRETAALQIVDAIEARKREAIITLHGKATVAVARHASPLVHAVLSVAGKKLRGRKTE